MFLEIPALPSFLLDKQHHEWLFTSHTLPSPPPALLKTILLR